MNILCKEKYLLVSVDNPEDPEAPTNQRAGDHLTKFTYASQIFFYLFYIVPIEKLGMDTKFEIN